jgi:heme oxygenase
MQRVVDGLERVLTPALESLLPDQAIRSKQDWLSSDLAPGSVKVNPYPPALFSVDGRDAHYALGAFYVLEGSTLGGRVILKSLPASLGVGTRYFEGFGAETVRMWQSFVANLCDAAATDTTAQQSIINGAIDTFAAISRYFNTCLAHEASGYSQS